MTIGGIIKEARLDHQLTQEDVARVVGTTKATVSRWESGDIKKMKTSYMQALAALLGLDVMLFFQREEVLIPDEYNVIEAYRKADEGTKAAIRKLLDVQEVPQ